MKPFGFFNQVLNSLRDFFRPERGQVRGAGVQDFVPEAPQAPSLPTPSPRPEGTIVGGYDYSGLPPHQGYMPRKIDGAGTTRDQSALAELIAAGLTESGFGQSPIATQSGQLAQAGGQLPSSADPLLPTILALMESRGLQDARPAQASNPYNIFYPGTQTPVNYGDPSVAILGGGPEDKLGLAGLLREEGPYQDYLNSGNLADFFTKFTPPSDPLNPSTDELIQRYNTLRAFFE